MPAVDWPSFFPNPELGLSMSFDSTIEQTEMDSGEYRQRPVRRGKRYLVRATFVLSGLRMAIFNGWFQHKIRDGVDAINFPSGLPVLGGDFTVAEAYVAESVYKASLIEAPNTWEVQFQLETFV